MPPVGAFAAQLSWASSNWSWSRKGYNYSPCSTATEILLLIAFKTKVSCQVIFKKISKAWLKISLLLGTDHFWMPHLIIALLSRPNCPCFSKPRLNHSAPSISICAASKSLFVHCSKTHQVSEHTIKQVRKQRKWKLRLSFKQLHRYLRILLRLYES